MYFSLSFIDYYHWQYVAQEQNVETFIKKKIISNTRPQLNLFTICKDQPTCMMSPSPTMQAVWRKREQLAWLAPFYFPKHTFSTTIALWLQCVMFTNPYTKLKRKNIGVGSNTHIRNNKKGFSPHLCSLLSPRHWDFHSTLFLDQ